MFHSNCPTLYVQHNSATRFSNTQLLQFCSITSILQHMQIFMYIEGNVSKKGDYKRKYNQY